MGCYPSSCWPGRSSEQATEEGNGMRGVVLHELGRWRSSIEMLEEVGKIEERKKKRKKKNPSHKGKFNTEDAGSTPHPTARVGLHKSYKDLKSLLFNGMKPSYEHASTNGSIATEDSFAREGSASSSRRKRGEMLQSMNSAEIMLSTDPLILRRKLLTPPHEAERQATVDAYKVVETAQDDPHYVSIVSLAAKIFKVPYAAIAIIDRKRIWMKAMQSDSQRPIEAPRDKSFVSYMLLNPKQEVMVVEDTNEDGRFHDLMRGRKAKAGPRFFAAAPLYAANGYQIGALVITDTKPRKLDAGSFTLLNNLAEMVFRALEKDAFGAQAAPDGLPPPLDDSENIEAPNIKAGESHLNVALISDLAGNKLEHSNSAIKSPAEKLSILRSTNMLKTGIMVCSTVDGGNAEVMFVNSIWSELTGISAEVACKQGLWQLFSIPGKQLDAVTKALQDAFAEQKTLDFRGKLCGGEGGVFGLSFKSAAADTLDQDMPLVGVPSFVEFSQQRNLCYFFVTVHKVPQPPPPSVFEAAAAVEPWGAPHDVFEEEMEDIALSPRKESLMQSKSSVTLPYNDTLFSEVWLGPLLGRGSFGKVHRGVWNEQQIAVKILEIFQQGEAGEEVDDLTEAALMESMRHENVMRTFRHATRIKHIHNSKRAAPEAFGDDQNGGYMLETWLLLEYCNKGSLQDANDRGWFRTEPSRAKGKPDMSIILPTALELAKGLQYLHGKGVLHGDLSPGNVLLSDKPDAPHGFTVKIADFGLSRATASKTIKTQTFGTVTHMPPELLTDGKLTTAADVYAFGVLLWGMYTGVPPWQGMRRTQVLFKVTALGASLQIPVNCPPFYKDLLERCMQRDHKSRPAFDDLVKELSDLVETQQSGRDLQDYPSDVELPASDRGSASRSTPLARAIVLPEVDESEPMGDAALRKTGSSRKSYGKTGSLQRRPSFSHSVQLEVV